MNISFGSLSNAIDKKLRVWTERNIIIQTLVKKVNNINFSGACNGRSLDTLWTEQAQHRTNWTEIKKKAKSKSQQGN